VVLGFAEAGVLGAELVAAGFAAGLAGCCALVCARAREAQRPIAAATAYFTRDDVIETSQTAVALLMGAPLTNRPLPLPCQFAQDQSRHLT
jgi:hypothetical protein